MRTSIDLPEQLLLRMQKVADSRGASLKDVIVSAIEREAEACEPQPKRVQSPLIRLPHGRKLNLEGIDFDDFLA